MAIWPAESMPSASASLPMAKPVESIGLEYERPSSAVISSNGVSLSCLRNSLARL